MTREQHLVFCEKCVNKKADENNEIICNLTGIKADFADYCPSYKLDVSNNNIVETNLSDEVADIQINEKTLTKLKSEQNFKLGLMAAVVVGIIGAVLWGVITVITEYQIGYMAIAIGAGVGYAMRYFGKGMDQIFGISGAVIAILSCVLGNFFSIIGFVANAEGLDYINTLMVFDYSQLVNIMTENFNPMDVLFYGFAGYEGYKFSFRVVTHADLV
jgi:hypothetical protein